MTDLSKRVRQNQVTYVVLRLGASSGTGAPYPLIRRTAAAAGLKLGAKIFTHSVVFGNGVAARHRFFLKFEGGKRDDDRAQRIAESFLHCCETLFGPILLPGEDRAVLPFSSAGLPARRRITVEELVDLVNTFDGSPRIFGPGEALNRVSGIGEEIVTIAWRATPLIVANDILHRAVSFVAASAHDFHVWPGELMEALADGDRIHSTAGGMVTRETAFQNSYKAIEALIGDPPKDEEKLRQKLQLAGVDPDEPIGYDHRKPLIEAVRLFNQIRDRRAAHGSTSVRGIKVREMVECQACAEHILRCALARSYGKRLFDVDSSLLMPRRGKPARRTKLSSHRGSQP